MMKEQTKKSGPDLGEESGLYVLFDDPLVCGVKSSFGVLSSKAKLLKLSQG